MTRQFWLCTLVVWGVAATVVAAQADTAAGPTAERDAYVDEQARAHFQTGAVACSAGRFADALVEFSKAYELSGRAKLLYNVAVMHDRLRHDAEALAAFEEFLRQVPDAPERPEVQARIAVLRDAVEGAGNPVPTEQRAAAASDEQTEANATTSSTPLWIALGTSVAVSVTGGVLLTLSAIDKGNVEGVKDGTRLSGIESAHDRIPTLSAVGGVMLGLGLVGTGISIALMLGTDEAEGVALNVGPGSIALRGAL